MDTITESEAETGRVVCPRSLQVLDEAPLAEGYKLHFVTPQELLENGGVCRACRERIIKFNRVERVVKEECPDRIGEHIDFRYHNFAPGVEGGVEIEANHLVPITTVEFPFDKVETLLGTIDEAPPDARQLAAELFREVMTWCFAGNPPLRTALVKVVSITAGLRPELLGDRTMTELAKEIGCTKQNMSKAMVTFGNEFNFHFTRGRSKEARAQMAAAARANHQRHRKQSDAKT